MHFRTKDLMITVLPASGMNPDLEKVCLWHTRICTAPSACQAQTCLVAATAGGDCPATFLTPPTSNCCPHNTFRLVGPGPCGHLTYTLTLGTCPYATFTDWITCPHTSYTQCFPHTAGAVVLNDREDLAALRIELQETLKALDKLEKTLPSGLATDDDKKMLLNGLEELRKRLERTPIDKP